jgi:hypothetical protein
MSTPTRFDPFIQAVARRAEGIYTKMAIVRDESQDLTRRRKNEGDTDVSSALWEDTTDVSVVALRGFLEDLLGLTHSASQMNTDLLPLPPVPNDQPTAPQTAASHAAQAYRNTGRVVHDENVEIVAPIPIIPPSNSTTDVRLGDDFGEAERETMRGYLSDLVNLERRGVEFLTLRRSLTFLESIDQAIKSAQ